MTRAPSELDDLLGIVDVKRAPLPVQPDDDDQSDPAPWWVIPAFCLFALLLVAGAFGISQAIVWFWGAQ